MASRTLMALVGHALVGACGLLLCAPAARAQNAPGQNPVFVNDSPAATDALISMRDSLTRGTIDQAVRLAQRLLDEHAEILVAAEADGSLFTSVRARVHEALLADGEFLARYRRVQSAAAQDDLAAGRVGAVERSRLMTPAGLEAALRVSAEHLEAGRFHAALLTLREIERHPDRAGPAGARVETIVRTLARYLPEASSLLAPGNAPARIEPPARPASLTPLSVLPRSDTAAIVAQPLSTTPFSAVDAGDGQRVSDDAPVFGRSLRSFPTLMGDTVFVSSGRQVLAFDRFTLSARWARSLSEVPGLDPAPRDEDRGAFRGRGFGPFSADDARLLTVSGSLLLAVASSDTDNAADARQAMAALDPSSGRLLWSIPLREIDPALERGTIRGPIMLDPSGTIAAASIRKNQRDRRLHALYLAAVNTTDGSPRWARLVASVGSLPFTQPGQLGDGAVLADGVIYAVDRLGVACAYEASGGRPVWVRRFPGESYEASFRPSAWQVNLPIVRGEEVIILSPDRRSVVWIDRASGRVRWTLEVTRESPVAYIVPVGDAIALVGDAQITLVPATKPEPRAGRTISFREGVVRGRVVASGDTLLAPLERGLAAITPDGTASVRALDESGNFVVADDQLIVADDARLHSYLSWDAADRLLAQRIAETPSDPAPGIALSEVAYRAGKDDRIINGIDAAAAALSAGDASPSNLPLAAARERLILSIRQMIDAAQGIAPQAGRSPLDRVTTGQIIERFGRLAQTPADRAAHLLVAGRQAEGEPDPVAAAARYQQVLDDPELASSLWQGARLGLRAETEATRRLEQLVAKAGAGAYAPFDAAARAAVAALPPDASIETMERLARRYPVSGAAPVLWGRVASAHDVEKRSRAAARALEIGLQAAQRIPGVDRAVAGELAGRLITNLVDRGLLVAADESLRRVRGVWGDLALTSGGKPVDGPAIAARIGAERSLSQRWPSVGLPIADGAQVLAGWALMEPVGREPLPSVQPYLALRHQDGRVAVFARAAANDDTLAPVWVRETEAQQAELLRQDRAAAYFYLAQEKLGGVIVKVDPATGKQVWATEGIASAFPPPARPAGPAAGVVGRPAPPERIATPLEGSRPASEVLFCSDERTLAMIERGARGVAYDADSGQRLWAATFPLSGVFDSAVFRNLLVVAGEAEQPGAAGRVRTPTVLVLDARTGELLQTVPLDIGAVRWVRFTPRGELIAGLTGAVVAIDAETGGVTWRNTQAPCAATQNAWVVGDSVIVQAEGRVLWLVAAGTGLLRPSPVDVRDRVDTSAPPRASLTADGRLALSTPAGLALIMPDGSVAGVDAVGQGESLVPAVPVEGGFLTIELETTSRDRTVAAAYAMHLLDAESAMLKRSVSLVLQEPPQRIAAMDGRVAVTAGHFTVVYAAPAGR